MPAQGLSKIDGEETYRHIYNRGVEKRVIFNDKEDYGVFLGYLKDYLTPRDPNSIKKDFEVRGHIFRGTPHQPKNYFNEVELIAYNLMPDHFHLLLDLKTKSSLENFIRSLCTRYSMYFNKKYQRTGALFEGPYKSVQVKAGLPLLHLTRYFHHTGDYSSYPEYLGSKKTLWVKPQAILSDFNKGKTSYKDFVEKYELDQKEKEIIKGIIFDGENEHLKRIDLTSNKEVNLEPESEHRSRVPEFVAISAVFLLLVTLGVRNIQVTTAKSQLLPTSIQSEPTPAVLADTKETNTAPDNAAKPKVTVIIKTADSSSSVNIRQEPTTSSPVMGRAKDGDTFEFVSLNSGWYEIKLDTGSTGFISASVVVEVPNN